MRESFERDRSRESDRKSLDSKRGIFTSKIMEKEKPNVSPYLDNSLDPNSLNNSKNENFFRREVHVSNPATHTHVNYHMGDHSSYRETASRITPPPEVRFHYRTTGGQGGQGGQVRGESPIRYIPIQNTHHSQIPPQVHHQPIEIRKTYVPHHIYNHIPVNMETSSVNHQSHSQGQTNTVAHSDEAYDLLLKEYEKLYSRLEKETEHSKQLEQALRNRPQNSYHIPERKDKRYELNIQTLHDRLFILYEQYVNKILKKRKSACESRLRELFHNASHQVSVSTVIEEHSY